MSLPARPPKGRPTKNDQDKYAHESDNQFTKFVAAYVARMDAGDSVYCIKDKLKIGNPTVGSSDGLVT